MFSALADLGRKLEAERELPPTGFASYTQPIKWLLHLWPDRAVLEPTTIDKARPFSGRTSGAEAHLLADEAAYALGVDLKDDGTTDEKAVRKHVELFRPLYQALRNSDSLSSPELAEAIDWFDRALDSGWLLDDPHLKEVRSKDWVSIMPEVGPLANTHLYMHPDAQAFWVLEMQRRCSQAEEEQGDTAASGGQCAICGNTKPLVRKLPLKVKLAAATPLHSLNDSAYTSFVGGSAPEKRAHLGLCFECADLAARAFNYLGETDQNRIRIAKHPTKSDALGNQYAMFWLKAPGALLAGDTEIDLESDEDLMLAAPIIGVERMSDSTLQQMENLLKTPWAPKSSHLKLSDFAFYLAVLSPNVGRIAVREWLPLSIETLKASLAQYLEATCMVNPYRERVTPASITTILEALGEVNADLSRALVRTAYGKSPPPQALLFLAGHRLNTLNALEQSLRDRGGAKGEHWNDDWPHALAAAIKLVRYYNRTEIGNMTELNPELASPAYQCGRLLAVLEEAQQVYTYHQMGERLKVSIVQRGYAGACATPAAVLGRLYKLAASVHLPDSGGFLNTEAEAISARLVELGGMPKRLNMNEQADFGLGFFQEKARIRQVRKEKPAQIASAEGGVDS